MTATAKISADPKDQKDTPARLSPREGMMAVVRNRRAMITGVQPYDAGPLGRFHLVEVEYNDGVGVETDQLLWEVEPAPDAVEPAALPDIPNRSPMQLQEFDAMIRACRWSALTPSLPFSGLEQDRPPLAAPLYGAICAEAYQLVPVLRALEMPRVALLLADAVGLGKTIQAGMVLRELMLRRRIRRILVLCPAALRSQWREEMQEKFALPFQIVDRPATLKLQREVGIDANPWRSHERIIASYHYLKQPDVLEQFRNVAEPGRDGDDKLRLTHDLLIVDEAHNLSPASFGNDSDLSRLLQRIAPWFEHRIFLTATPHNGHTRSFSGLLEALDPVRFTRKSALDKEDRQRIPDTVIRRLKSEINQSYTDLGEPPRFAERQVTALPTIRFGTHERALQLALRDFRRALDTQLRSAGTQERNAANFATEVLQKRLLSGPWAFGQSWLALMQGLEEPTRDPATADTVVRARQVTEDDTDDDAERESRQRHADRTVGAWLRKWHDSVALQINAVTDHVKAIGVARIPAGLAPADHQQQTAALAGKVAADARLHALQKHLIDKHLRHADTWRDNERLVIFTEYLATHDYICARLRQLYGPHDDQHDWLLSLYGGMDDTGRDAVKHQFNDPASSARILVATDAAGEGLNLQRAARYLLHWDIPWNPARMEQRNGRLDRHGQARDVTIYHFDSTDDASMSFLGKVLHKRSQTREDRIITDQIFADAILTHFAEEESATASEYHLQQAIDQTTRTDNHIQQDLPPGTPLPGKEDLARLDHLKDELDISPDSLRDTLETALAINAGRPRLQPDQQGRDRLKHPVPALWQQLVDDTLRTSPTGPLLALVFNPDHYIKTHDGTPVGRPVYTPEPDSRLLHLGDTLYHRVISTFAHYRFPGGPQAATRWAVRTAPIPGNYRALVLLTIEELAVNQLREPCHHWVRTIAWPIADQNLQDPLPHQPAARWAAPPTCGDLDTARDLWDDIEDQIKDRLKTLEQDLNTDLVQRLKTAGKTMQDQETKRFARRRREISNSLKDNQLAKLVKEADRLREKIRQKTLFSEIDREQERSLADLDAELELRKTHYNQVLDRLDDEQQRTLEQTLPYRYTLRGQARIYPIAVEIRLPPATP